MQYANCDKAKHASRTLKYHKAHPIKRKLYKRISELRKRGLTLQDFQDRLEKQNGVCAICLKPPSGRWNKLHVDHNHLTGRVRDLLCHNCNIAIGHAWENINILNNMIIYLEKHNA